MLVSQLLELQPEDSERQAPLGAGGGGLGKIKGVSEYMGFRVWGCKVLGFSFFYDSL